MKLKNKLILSILMVTCLGTVIFITYFLNQNPLVSDGFSEYNNQRTLVDISIINKGVSDIYLQDIKINDKLPLKTQLVISYTAQLVAGGIDDKPLARFLEINEEPIHPELTPQEKQEAFKTKTTAIHYGIRINSEEDITTIKIKYRYFGIPFEREINLDKWPE